MCVCVCVCVCVWYHWWAPKPSNSLFPTANINNIFHVQTFETVTNLATAGFKPSHDVC